MMMNNYDTKNDKIYIYIYIYIYRIEKLMAKS